MKQDIPSYLISEKKVLFPKNLLPVLKRKSFQEKFEPDVGT